MKYLALATKAKILQQDRILTDPNVVAIGDDLALSTIRLAERLKAEGIEMHTVDMMPLDKFDAFLFSDMPGKNTEEFFTFAKKNGKKTILSVSENHFIAIGNQDYHRYKDFDLVFSYDDNAVEKYGAIKQNYSFDFSRATPSTIPFKERKFAVMISACMKRNIPHNISYMRLQALEYYAKNHPDMIDLYGRGWDKGPYIFQDKPEVFKITHKLFIDKLLPRRKFSMWKGPCQRKRDVLGKYKFVYCYENTDEIPGYITEKIFDAFMNGVVPIYINHPATDKYIPRDAYINRKDFVDDAALFEYLATMSEETWQKYYEAGQSFLKSEAAEAFSIDYQCEVFAEKLKGILEL